jgi:hypothetical protein
LEPGQVYARIGVVQLFAGLLDIVNSVGGLADAGGYECLECGCVFRPTRGSNFGKLNYAIVALFLLALLVLQLRSL